MGGGLYMTLFMKYQEKCEEGAIFERIDAAREYGISDEEIIKKLISKFDLSEEEARSKLLEYDSLQPV